MCLIVFGSGCGDPISSLAHAHVCHSFSLLVINNKQSHSSSQEPIFTHCNSCCRETRLRQHLVNELVRASKIFLEFPSTLGFPALMRERNVCVASHRDSDLATHALMPQEESQTSGILIRRLYVDFANFDSPAPKKCNLIAEPPAICCPESELVLMLKRMAHRQQRTRRLP